MSLDPSDSSNNSQIHRKTSPGGIIQRAANDSGRLVSYVFSDTSVGRDNHVIAADAWQLTNYLRNPVFLWAHDREQPPIGKIVDISTQGSRLVGTVEYADVEANPFADTIFRLVKAGMINATSTSWKSIEYKFTTDRSRPGGIDYTKVDLLEISQVPVPALPTALVTARAYGIDTKPFVAWAESALDRGNTLVPKGELEMIYRGAGAPKFYGAASIEDRRTKARAAAIAAGTASPFDSFGMFLQAVATNINRGADTDTRLVRAPTGLGESAGSLGGFLVPTEYIETLIGSIYEDAILAPRCDRRKTDRPADTLFPAIDEESRADGSRWGGVLSYWSDEGIEPPTTLPKYRAIELGAKKLIALSVASAELIQDASMLEAHVTRAFAAEGSFKLDYAVLRGTGAGMPLGIVNAPGTITVAKANGQAPGTIVAENIAAMWSRLPAPCRKRAVWIVNEDAEAQLDQLGASGSSPATAGMYYPAGANGNEFALIKGRPVIVAEQCPVLGTPGDIVLADLNQYVIVETNLKVDLSLDVFFDNGQGMFRFVWRGNGAPIWTTPIAPFNGGATRSPYVILGAR